MGNICLDQNYSTTRLLSIAIANSQVNLFSNNILPNKSFLHGAHRYNCEGGLRTRGYFKQSYEKKGESWLVCNADGQLEESVELLNNLVGNELPLITIITVVFNGEKFLEDTIKSVINQTYPNIEYIIIDGGSTDDTLKIIQKYESVIDYWISEKDDGIYDAMNKGINLSCGTWINFMNCGDVFNGIGVFEGFNSINDRIDIIFSDTILLNANKQTIHKASIKSKSFIHQSIIYRRDIHRIHGLYLTATGVTISDYLFFSNLLREENSIWINHPISIYRIDGVSSKPSHYYQKLGVNLIYGHSSTSKVVLQLSYKILLQYFYYPIKKIYLKFGVRNG